MSDYEDHDFDCECDECYEEGYDEGYDDGYRSARRSSSSHGHSSGSSEGCYVATAVYGSYDCPEVWVLRRFRDSFLRNYGLGRAFIKVYYRYSPGFVARYGHCERLSNTIRCALNQFVRKLKDKGYSDKPYSD